MLGLPLEGHVWPPTPRRDQNVALCLFCDVGRLGEGPRLALENLYGEPRLGQPRRDPNVTYFLLAWSLYNLRRGPNVVAWCLGKLGVELSGPRLASPWPHPNVALMLLQGESLSHHVLG
ncbi:hypothetical protein PIB30_007226 [Stylosanthes scabra]|uniref:Uncharacterized protein n=1 Tax=Stylosanthes scabra TaxID=79078 RepID=A0ABU6V2S5_9FABA|nr:hypothetical protein [Stylosanthes scabra]